MAASNDTDYGNLVHKTPSTIEQPADVAALAAVLKKYDAAGTPVRIRNTAHSTNGQTVTDGVQVQLGGLSGATFDRERMTVTAGAGTPWNDVLKAVGFPRFCPPMFPNNPGQLIRIGGTAAVGGVGFYGAAAGGFWNAVESIELVTMKGERITCSPTQNPDYFFYSLGGFSRLGVMASVTVRVVDSAQFVIAAILVYRDLDAYVVDLEQARKDPFFNGVATQEDISGGVMHADDPGEPLSAHITTKLDLKLLTVIHEVVEPDAAALEAFDSYVKKTYHGGVVMYMDLRDSNIDTRFEPVAFPKREIVYFYPAAENFWVYLLDGLCDMLVGRRPLRASLRYDDPALVHPWCDCILPRASYNDFMKEAKRIIVRYGLKKNISKQSVFHGLLNIDSFVTFFLKKHSDAFPVALDLPNEPDMAMGVAIMPDVARDLQDKAVAMADELTALCYEMNGRRYLYGYHNLTPAQVVKHYGTDTITKWNRLKNELDPKHLLNIGVIPHLDTF
ncbi:MAG: FAD-binding protein [Betaproteobacteria bacterium]|nr:FAD-binding protein [Betaproteobacteria bacterium]